MKLGVLIGYSGGSMDIGLDHVKEAEAMGYESAWTAEAYGSDAVTPAAWVLANTTKIKVGTAIMQLPARSPAATAMTAMTLDALSGGRFILGLGPSGPQVAEGWHGVPYGKPLTKMREYVTIVRQILERKGPLVFQGEEYQIPNTGPGTTGLGKPLKSILHGDPSLKIYSASITPGGVRTAAELFDGFFPIWMNPGKISIFKDNLLDGFAKAGNNKSLADFDVAPFVTIVEGDDIDKCRDQVRPGMALYIGGMGAKGKNFYNDYCKRLGYEDAAVKIQDAFLDGRRDDAMAAIPDALIDDVALCGNIDRIKGGLEVWKEAGKKKEVGSMLLGNRDKRVLKLLAEEMLS
ncbi:MAG: LLM class F420-dependent oxidoreductase [Alphaproteobacteria bacterium]|nr:MAG: LLM class F420-dependent oxidoreductase [Alphaproteobacteria bacterium]